MDLKKAEMRKLFERLREYTEQLAKIEELEQRIAADGGETVVPL